MATVSNNKYALSSKQRLQLQQLLTQKYISEKSVSHDSAISEKGGSEGNESMEGNQDPEKWQLISSNISLHEWQRKCLDKWLNTGRGTVKVATGGGKTIFALAAAQTLQNVKSPDLRLAIVVPTIPLMNQWLDEFIDASIPQEKIGLMGGGNTVPDNPEIKVVICVLNSARDLLPELIRKFGWNDNLMLIVDECHKANAEQARKIFEAKPKYTLGLSATPESSTDDLEISTDAAYAASPVGQGLGPIIFDFTLKESLEAGLLPPFEVWHVALPLSAKERIQYDQLSKDISELARDLRADFSRGKKTGNFLAWCKAQAKKGEGGNAARFIGLTSDRKQLVYRASARSKLTLDILSAATQEEDRRVIVFHEVIELINDMFAEAMAQGIPAVLEHSNLSDGLRAENIDIFRKGLAKAIISAKSLVEGFNVPSADIGIIAASSGSVRQRIQSLGRMLRKKAKGDKAIIFVLYMKDTNDDLIYQKADWEGVIGADKNRYFEWLLPAADSEKSPDNLADILGQFKETHIPPRKYRPPCGDVDTSILKPGDEYPGQTVGDRLKVDSEGNLRTEEDTLLPAPREAVESIVKMNEYKRAICTPCGHLICRTDSKDAPEEFWVYLGELDDSGEKTDVVGEKFMLKDASGKRVISRKMGRHKEVYARGPDKASSKEAGLLYERILEWLDMQEKQHSTSVRSLYWDRDKKYWIEVSGERIFFNESAGSLEFPQ